MFFICCLGGCNLLFGIGDIEVDSGPECGDSEVVFPEVCDDGNTVDGDGCNSSCSALTCQVPAIQPSILAALSEDCGTIQLAVGTYQESLVVRREVTIEALTDGVTLSGGGAELIVATMPLTLRRLTVSGGSSDLGGGINSTADLLLEDVVVENNAATIGGAGVHVAGATLTATNLTVRGNTLSGTEGAGVLIRDGEFSITDSTIANNAATSSGTVFGTGLNVHSSSGTLSRVSISENTCNASACSGVGISVFNETVALSDVQIENNVSNAPLGSGVGLRLEDATVTFSGGVVGNNRGTTSDSFGDLVEGTIRGGGIHVIDSDLALSKVTVVGNSLRTGGTGGFADGAGMNVYSAGTNGDRAISILDCSFTQNLSTSIDLSNSGVQQGSAGGGGLTANNAAGATLSISIERSAFINNSTSGNFSSGGGIRVFGATNDGSLTVKILNTTISGNSTDGEASAQGAGLLQGNSNIDLRHVTVFNNEFLNSPTQTGTGLFATGDRVTVENSILAGNVGTSDCGTGTASSLFFDAETILGNATNCVFTGTPRLLNPLVNSLADNGGPTQTHSLQPGSPALESGSVAGCVGLDGARLTVDQRGELRDAMCDVGAFEGVVP